MFGVACALFSIAAAYLVAAKVGTDDEAQHEVEHAGSDFITQLGGGLVGLHNPSPTAALEVTGASAMASAGSIAAPPAGPLVRLTRRSTAALNRSDSTLEGRPPAPPASPCSHRSTVTSTHPGTHALCSCVCVCVRWRDRIPSRPFHFRSGAIEFGTYRSVNRGPEAYHVGSSLSVTDTGLHLNAGGVRHVGKLLGAQFGHQRATQLCVLAVLTFESIHCATGAAAEGHVTLNRDSDGHVLLGNGGGNVGVGIATPAHKLHVLGNALVDGDLRVARSVLLGPSATRTGVDGEIVFTGTDFEGYTPWGGWRSLTTLTPEARGTYMQLPFFVSNQSFGGSDGVLLCPWRDHGTMF